MSEEEQRTSGHLNYTNALLKANNEISSDIDQKLSWILAFLIFIIVFLGLIYSQNSL